MRVRLIFELKRITVLILAYIMSAEIFAGQFAPIGHGEWTLVPPYSQTSLKRGETVTPPLACRLIMSKSKIQIRAKTIYVAYT